MDLTQYNNGQPFDDSSAPQARSFEPIPPGEYPMEVISAGMHDTRAGTGCYMKLEMAVIGQVQQGRKVFWNINLKNPNPKAEEIGREHLDQVRQSVGLVSLTDSSQLIGGKLTAKLIVDGEYNNVSYVKALDESAAIAQPQSPPPFPAPTQQPAQPAQQPQQWAGAAQPQQGQYDNVQF